VFEGAYTLGRRVAGEVEEVEEVVEAVEAVEALMTNH